MDLFRKKERILKQDLSQTDEHYGKIFVIHLLMEKMCAMPDRKFMCDVMEKHFGNIKCFCHDGKVAGFAPEKYKVHYEKENKDVPPQLMIMECTKIQTPVMDEISESQLWDCADGKEILEKCRYQVFATDMMAQGLNYKERAEMLVRYIEALVEMYPSCRAVVFETSKKMIAREDIVSCTVPEENRFIYYAVNARFFKIQGTDDMIVDTIGMGTLFMPDLQYHFHDMNPDTIVNHAYNLLSYIYSESNPVKSGDTIDGVTDNKISPDIQWTLQYENSLIQPVREVIDVNMGRYASGNRN